MERVRAQFSAKLASARRLKKISTNEIALALGMTPENYLRLEKGQQSCSYERIIQIAVFLDVSIDELLSVKASTNGLEPSEQNLLSHYQALPVDIKIVTDLLIRSIYLNKPTAPLIKSLIAVLEATNIGSNGG